MTLEFVGKKKSNLAFKKVAKPQIYPHTQLNDQTLNTLFESRVNKLVYAQHIQQHRVNNSIGMTLKIGIWVFLIIIYFVRISLKPIKMFKMFFQLLLFWVVYLQYSGEQITSSPPLSQNTLLFGNEGSARCCFSGLFHIKNKHTI